MTHSELVSITAQKAQGLFGCGLILMEPRTTRLHFSPDVFAVKKGGLTFQFEIKVSRSDFLKDFTKPHRKTPDKDVGVFRYFVTPYGMISPDDPLLSSNGVNWGLLEVSGSGSRMYVRRGPNPSNGLLKMETEFPDFMCPRDSFAEMELVYSYYRSLVVGSNGEAVQVSSIAERIYHDSEQLRSICARIR